MILKIEELDGLEVELDFSNLDTGSNIYAVSFDEEATKFTKDEVKDIVERKINYILAEMIKQDEAEALKK